MAYLPPFFPPILLSNITYFIVRANLTCPLTMYELIHIAMLKGGKRKCNEVGFQTILPRYEIFVKFLKFIEFVKVRFCTICKHNTYMLGIDRRSIWQDIRPIHGYMSIS